MRVDSVNDSERSAKNIYIKANTNQKKRTLISHGASVGSIVYLRSGHRTRRYLLVGSTNGRFHGIETVPVTSPLGKQIVGMRIGEQKAVRTAYENFYFKLVRIE